jgi:hypothetical protein
MEKKTRIRQQTQPTERRGLVVNSPTSCLGRLGFKSRPRRQIILTEVFRVFPQSLQANVGI